MKKKVLAIAACFSVLIACNNNDNNGSNVADGAKPDSVPDNTSNTNNPANTAAQPLSKDDSSFVMEAAVGGLMEVQSGQLAQQNGMSQRVKDFGAMMVRDHEKANQELMSLASGAGMSLPTALPADKQKHMDEMKNMKGKAFDNHYASMMVNDHQKTIDLFEKQASGGTNPQLKTWASNTLPTLKAHMDSAQALKKRM